MAIRSSPLLISIALFTPLCILVACSPEEENLPADQSLRSAVKDTTGAPDGTTARQDVGAQLLECRTDSKCVAKYPQQPQCRRAACVEGECKLVVANDDDACDDGNKCTQGDYCLAGSCREGQPKDCADDNPCTQRQCAPSTGACVAQPAQASCGGDKACSKGVCEGGVCVQRDKLFSVNVPLPGAGTVSDVVVLANGNLATIASLDAPSAATRVVVVTADGAGGGPAASELLPMSLAWAAVAVGSRALLAGEVTVTGRGQDAVVLAREAGKTVFQRRYGGKGHDTFRAVVALPDGGFAAVGGTASRGNGQHDAWFIRGSKTGFPKLDYTYGSKDDEMARDLAARKAGGFILVGDQAGVNGSDALVFAIAANAKLLWLKHLGGGHIDRLDAVVLRVDGSIAAAGSTQKIASGGPVAWLTMLNATGKLLWQRTWPVNGRATVSDMQTDVAATGGLWLTGWTTDQAGVAHRAPWIARADSAGNLMWTKQPGFQPHVGPAAAVALRPLSDGAVLLSGSVTPTAAAQLARIDLFGHSSCGASGDCVQKPGKCDDGNACTADSCAAATGCVATPLPDGTACGGGGSCVKGTCK